jgi:hypothetical protein
MTKYLKPALLLAAVAIMAIGMLGSGAWFTDTATNQTAALSSGTLSIDDGKVAEFSLGAITNMAPGDVTDEVTIIIKNNGTLDLAWFGDLIVSGDLDLKDAIYIDYAKMEFFDPDGVGQWEPVDNFITNGVGSGPYPSWFNTLAGQSPFGVVTLMSSTPTTAWAAPPMSSWARSSLATSTS